MESLEINELLYVERLSGYFLRNLSYIYIYMFSNKPVWILIVIFITTLVVSLLNVNLVPVKEGLSNTELAASGPIKKAMETYKNIVDKNCQAGLSKIASVQGLSQLDSISLSPIVANENTTNTYKIQQIVGLNSTTEGLKTVLNEIMGKNYSALLSLFQTIPLKTTDPLYDKLVADEYAKLVAIVTDTDVSSPYAVLDDYLKSDSVTNK